MLGVRPAAQRGRSGVQDGVGVLVHADRVVPAAPHGCVSGAIVIADGMFVAEPGGVVGFHAAEVLNIENSEKDSGAIKTKYESERFVDV